MNDIEQRAIAEWWRLNEIYQHAKHARLDYVLATTLAAMNTIVRILGYEPDEGKTA